MRTILKAALLAAAGALALTSMGQPAAAQDTVKVGLILPMTGPFASTGRQIADAAKLYMSEHGDTAGGKKLQLILKDDTGTADLTKRLAQELLVRDRVDVLAGFGLTPLALAAAPLATQAKKMEVVMAAATSMITEASPYITRTSFTLPQATMPMAEWAAKNGIKSVVTLVSDYGPGLDAEKAFTEKFTEEGGKVAEKLRVPVANPDFAPFLQKVADAKPDALFVFVPSGVGATLMKQFGDRGLKQAGIKLIGTGDVTDDDILNEMGDVALGTITSHHYSAAHDSPENKKFVAEFEKQFHHRPNFMAVGGYDGMALIYQALEKTKGDASGPALIKAVEGMEWTSPRGPMKIDPDTRDVIQNIYIRRVEKKDGQLWNVEFDTIPMVKDPYHGKKG